MKCVPTTMENHQKGRAQPKKVKILSTSSLLINEKDASQLVGSIVEKGISDSHNNPTTPFISFPKPTVLPFPVARHRSHGPVSALSFSLNSPFGYPFHCKAFFVLILYCIMLEFN